MRLLLLLAGFFLIINFLIFFKSEAYMIALNSRYHDFIPPGLFQRLQFFILLFDAFFILLIFQVKTIIATIRNVFKEISTLTLFPKLSSAEKRIVTISIAVIIISRICLLIFEPFDADEIWSYLAFRNKPFFVPLFWYPIPGNHIFQTFLSRVFLSIDISQPWLMRVPVLLAGLLCLYYLFRLLCFWVSVRTAIISILIFSFLPWVYFYSISARGYSFVLLCFVALLAHGYLYLNNEKKCHLFFLAIYSVIGFYTIPTFLYCFISGSIVFFIVIAFQWKENKGLLLPLVKAVIASIIICLVLYIPVMVINGSDALFHNDFVLPLSYRNLIPKLPLYLSELGSYILFEIQYALIFRLFIVASTAYWLVKRQMNLFLGTLIIVGLTLPLFFIFIQRVLPPYRVYLYLSVPVILWLAFAVEKLKEAQRYIVLLICVGELFVFYKLFHLRYDRYQHATIIAKKLVEQKASNYIFGDSYYALIFEFEFYRTNNRFTFSVDASEEKANKIFIDNRLKKQGIIYADSLTEIYNNPVR